MREMRSQDRERPLRIKELSKPGKSRIRREEEDKQVEVLEISRVAGGVQWITVLLFEQTS